MSQRFRIINLDKQEAIRPVFGAFLEIIWSKNMGKHLLYLLRKSSNVGGGDVDENYGWEYLGRWAGDRIMIIGDYDESDIYEKTEKYKDITEEVEKEFKRCIKD